MWYTLDRICVSRKEFRVAAVSFRFGLYNKLDCFFFPQSQYSLSMDLWPRYPYTIQKQLFLYTRVAWLCNCYRIEKDATWEKVFQPRSNRNRIHIVLLLFQFISATRFVSSTSSMMHGPVLLWPHYSEANITKSVFHTNWVCSGWCHQSLFCRIDSKSKVLPFCAPLDSCECKILRARKIQ